MIRDGRYSAWVSKQKDGNLLKLPDILSTKMYIYFDTSMWYFLRNWKKKNVARNNEEIFEFFGNNISNEIINCNFLKNLKIFCKNLTLKK